MTDLSNKKPELKIVRHFNAPMELVFDAFADKDAMAEWWGPAGMPATVVYFDFKPAGKFHYKLEGNGQVMWGLFRYKTINRADLIEFVSSFSDEEGNVCPSPFPMDFPLEIFNQVTLVENNGRTTLTLQGYPINATEEQEATYASITSNMEQGFKGTFDQLERYLSAQFELRKNLKPNNKARVCTYLNFPGNTEEVLNFYKSVFNTEFGGQGLSRFGDFQSPEGQPPMPEDLKKLILHGELPIAGGHVLMATDAPESMGFKVNSGNNMHIYIETESRQETKRLYDALSEGGVIENQLQDMFWGAYYGNFADKYGINWMLSYTETNNQ